VFVRIAGTVVAILLLVAAVGAATAYAAVSSWLKGLPDYTSPDAFRVAQPTKIYSADGKLLVRIPSFAVRRRQLEVVTRLTTIRRAAEERVAAAQPPPAR